MTKAKASALEQLKAIARTGRVSHVWLSDEAWAAFLDDLYAEERCISELAPDLMCATVNQMRVYPRRIRQAR